MFRNKKLWAGAAALVGIAVWVFFQLPHYPDGLELTVFDVGQGDAILLRTPENHKILIDGGPDSSAISKLTDTLGYFDRKLDMVVLTHPHLDHVAGLIPVLQKYQVSLVYFTGVLHTSNQYREWLALIKEKNIPVRPARAPDILQFGDLKLKTLYPTENLVGEKVTNLNNSSVVLRAEFQDVKILLTGDAEQEVEAELVREGADLKADILKVGHHGSKTSVTVPFLNKVRPGLAIISVGSGNRYGHPSPKILDRLTDFGAIICRTDLHGDCRVKIQHGRWYY